MRRDQVAAYGRFAAEPAQAELERFFLLDETDRDLIGKRRAVGALLYARNISSEQRKVFPHVKRRREDGCEHQGPTDLGAAPPSEPGSTCAVRR